MAPDARRDGDNVLGTEDLRRHSFVFNLPRFTNGFLGGDTAPDRKARPTARTRATEWILADASVGSLVLLTAIFPRAFLAAIPLRDI